ncbi:MAG: hypothetical protein OHK003_24020 [Anaerolineales bacterium]
MVAIMVKVAATTIKAAAIPETVATLETPVAAIPETVVTLAILAAVVMLAEAVRIRAALRVTPARVTQACRIQTM